MWPGYVPYVSKEDDKQHYYENLGKYDWYISGWSDWDPLANPYLEDTALRDQYRAMRQESNESLDTANEFMWVSVVARAFSMVETTIIVHNRRDAERARRTSPAWRCARDRAVLTAASSRWRCGSNEARPRGADRGAVRALVRPFAVAARRGSVPAPTTPLRARGTTRTRRRNPRRPFPRARRCCTRCSSPGWGDYQLGNRGRAAAFFAVEGAIWVSYAVFQSQGGGREDEYQNLAVQFAGVARTDHSDEFYATIRDYDNSDVYEADVKDDGRDLGQVLTNEQMQQYFIENRVADYEPWTWTSLERRLQYSEMRSSSKTAYRRADYMFAAAAANRLVSAIFAYASARGMQKDKDVGYRLDLSPAPGGVDVAFTLTRRF